MSNQSSYPSLKKTNKRASTVISFQYKPKCRPEFDPFSRNTRLTEAKHVKYCFTYYITCYIWAHNRPALTQQTHYLFAEQIKTNDRKVCVLVDASDTCTHSVHLNFDSILKQLHCVQIWKTFILFVYLHINEN